MTQPTLRIEHDAPLRALNTFGVAARAARLITLETEEQLPELRAALGGAAEAFVLGGGSNVLFTADVPGTVLRVALRGVRIVREDGDAVEVEAAAGEDWDALVRWTLAQGLCGLENLSLIPGTVGAAPIQNIGAYGVELQEVFDSLDAISLRTGEAMRFGAAECAFGYRDSFFKRSAGRDWLILRVRLRLSRTPRLHLSYGDIGQSLRDAGVLTPTASDVAAAVRRIRTARLPDPARLGNAGSFFKNPIVPAAFAEDLRSAHPAAPAWPAALRGAPAVKLSAAWLIERCGWKGVRAGDAGVDARHALVLVNHGSATGAELLALAERIRASVEERFGVRLEPEPVLVPAP